jgi:TrmH family RNA methyltransferase
MQKSSPHDPITSKDNSVIKHLRSLSDPKHRKKEQAFVIEGVKMVKEALRDKAGLTMLVASPALMQHQGKGLLKLADASSIKILWISDKLMEGLSENKTPQPVLAVAMMKEHSRDVLLSHHSKLIIIAHEIQDPGNLGTIMRTAEAAGAAGLVLTPNTADPFSPKAVRASMGSILRLPVHRIGRTDAFLKLCRQRGFQVVATVLTDAKSPSDVNLTKPTVVIVGQEGSGLPQDVIADVDVCVRIPMARSVDSLNVASSCAVILYEIMRQRMQR